MEAEEAKSELALLRAKADQWIAFHEVVTKALGHFKRGLATLVIDPESKTERWNLEQIAPSFGEAMNIAAILRLDDDLKAAYNRVENANSKEKETGFS